MSERKVSEDYLKSHSIEPAINEIVNFCVKQQPSDPYMAMSDMLRAKSGVTNGITDLEIFEVFSCTQSEKSTFAITAKCSAGEASTQVVVKKPKGFSLKADFELIAKILADVDPTDQKLIDEKILSWKSRIAESLQGDAGIERLKIIHKFCFPISWCCFKLNCMIQKCPPMKAISALSGLKPSIPKLFAEIACCDSSEVAIVKSFHISVEGAENLLEEAQVLQAMCKTFEEIYHNKTNSSASTTSSLKAAEEKKGEELTDDEKAAEMAIEFVEEVMRTFGQAIEKNNLRDDLSFSVVLEFPDCCKITTTETGEPIDAYYDIGLVKMSSREWATIVRKIVSAVQTLEARTHLTGLWNPAGVTDSQGLSFLEEGTSDEISFDGEDEGEETPVNFPQLSGMSMFFSTTKRAHLGDIVEEGEVENVVLEWQNFETVSLVANDLAKLKGEDISTSFDAETNSDPSLMAIAVGAGCDGVFVGDLRDSRTEENVNALIRLKQIQDRC